jgi:hypothetical protein
MRGAIPPLPNMRGAPLKAQGQLYLLHKALRHSISIQRNVNFILRKRSQTQSLFVSVKFSVLNLKARTFLDTLYYVYIIVKFTTTNRIPRDTETI